MSSSISWCLENLPKSGVVNVYGKSGIGKTTYFSTRLKHIKLDHEVLKSKERTRDFMDMMRYAMMPLVLDDYELVEDAPGIKELTAVRVPLYIISKERITQVASHFFEFPGVPVEEFASRHGLSVEEARRLLDEADGNMSKVRIDLENFKSDRDVFLSSKEYVRNMITSRSKMIDRYMFEHGNTFGMIHENYPDVLLRGESATLENLARVSQSLCDADVIDAKIYSDVFWDLMPFFNVSACLIPAEHFSEPPSLNSLRPGSIWTKRLNAVMKMNRLKKLRMHRDCIQLWVEKLNAGEEASKEHSSYDLDSINQLSFRKIKPRVLTLLKKKCRKE